MPITSVLEQAKNIEHLAGVRDGLWNELYVSSHSRAAFKSNIYTLFIPFFSILVME